MSPIKQFIRNVELLIFPLAENEGGGSLQNAIRIFSNGSGFGLGVKFAVKKSLLGAPNSTTIEITNMGKDTLKRISANAKVQLSVGWANTGTEILTSGAILSMVTEKDGVNLSTKLNILDGFGATSRNTTNKTFDGTRSVSSVVSELGGSLDGVTLGNIDVSGALGNGGLTMSDLTSDILDDLATQFGFSWSIQNGVFQAVDDLRSLNLKTVISADNNSLIKITPILNGVMQVKTGVEVTAILNPQVTPASRIDVRSNVSPDLNGIYKAHSIDYKGDTRGNIWEMVIQSLQF